MTKSLRAWVALAALVGLGLTACSSLDDERVPLASAPLVSTTPLPGANHVNLVVSAVDRRAQPQDGIGIKFSYIKSSRFLPANDIADVIRDAVAGELKAEGFVLGPGGSAVTIDIQNVFFARGAANVTFTLYARDAAGATLYRRTYEGNARPSFNVNPLGTQAHNALQQALADAIRQMADDKALQMALLSSARRRR